MWGLTKTEPVRQQINRRRSHESLILEMFKNGETVSTTTLRRFSANHTARISELRHEGHVILRNYVGNGVYEYNYLGDRSEK